jgi:hypothetical protein
MDGSSMNLTPPPTPKELRDLKLVYMTHIPEVDFVNNIVWYNTWGAYLIGLRRSYQTRFLSEAYNEHSSGS